MQVHVVRAAAARGWFRVQGAGFRVEGAGCLPYSLERRILHMAHLRNMTYHLRKHDLPLKET